jgi:hypothetical protein
MKKPIIKTRRNSVYPEEEIRQPEVDYQSRGFDPKKLVQAYVSFE